MKKKTRFFLGFVFFWCALVVVFDVLIARDLLRQWRSRSFVPIEGRILSNAVVRESGSEDDTYRAAVRYEYFLGGHRYESTRVRFGDIGNSNDRAAADVVRANPVGSSRLVYYNPAKPSEAVLYPGFSSQLVFFTVFLTPFNVAGIFLVGAALSLLRAVPLAGGAMIRAVGNDLYVNYKRVTRSMAALAAFGAVSFVGMFILAIRWKMVPPISASLGVWGIGAVCALLLVLARDAKNADMIVSSADEAVSLRYTQFDTLAAWRAWKRAGQPRTVVHFRQIRAIEVRTKVSKDSDGDRQSYSPTLVTTVRDEKGAPAIFEMGTWFSEEHAEAFATWLRGTVGLSAASARF
jgi:hypothetical protein